MRYRHQATLSTVSLRGESLEAVVNFEYPGACAADVKHHTDDAVSRFTSLWCSAVYRKTLDLYSISIKARLHKIAVQLTMTHGCESRYFDETAQRTLNGVNAWMSAARSAHEEASSLSVDVVKAIRTRIWRWLDHIL